MEKEINKKSKSWIFIVVLLIFILIVVSYIARVALSVETEDEIMEDEVLEIDNNADDEGKTWLCPFHRCGARAEFQ